MDTNALPRYDMSDNPTGCCPKFNPKNWDSQDLHFEEKLFVRAKTKSLAHIPLNMGSVFRKTFQAIEESKAMSEANFIVLSRECSPWSAEHLFAVTKEVPDLEMTRLSGDFITRVFEGPYKNLPTWDKALVEDLTAQGKEVNQRYFFYTTCPKCAKAYGKNYVVGVAAIQ